MIKLEFDLRTVSGMNVRENHFARAKRVKNERKVVWAEWVNAKASFKSEGPIIVRFTRLAPRKLDSDNLQSAFKGARDEIARLIGIDDGSDRITWIYDHEPSKQYRVRIEIYNNPSGKNWTHKDGRKGQR